MADGWPEEMSNASNTVESEFVAAFVLPARRERLTFELRSPAKRSRFFQKLSHRYFDYLDERLATPLALGDPVSIGELLRRKGAPDSCHVMSDVLRKLDGREVPLLEALPAVVGSGMPCIVICRPLELAYFEAEQTSGAPPRYCLERRP
jgi:hypothetical protein